MSEKRDGNSGRKGQSIDTGISGLFEALNEAIGEIAAKLEDGKSGTVSRDHTFETPKGPMRAHAGIRVRMGGLDIGDTSQKKPQPVNPDRPKGTWTKETAKRNTTKSISYDLFEEDNVWVLTADLPGVSRKELALSRMDNDLLIQTTGRRLYEARIALTDHFEIEQISVSLRNGILVLKIPTEAA